MDTNKLSEPMRTIDITPTWGEWANIYWRFAELGKAKAVRELRADFAKAMAAAQALQAITDTLSDEQADIVSRTMIAELTKQGF
jgi:23S rRNA maturation mini-RNase III